MNNIEKYVSNTNMTVKEAIDESNRTGKVVNLPWSEGKQKMLTRACYTIHENRPGMIEYHGPVGRAVRSIFIGYNEWAVRLTNKEVLESHLSQ